MKRSIPRIAFVLTLLLSSAAAAMAQDNSSAARSGTGPQQPAADPIQQIPHTLKALQEAKAGKYGKLRSDDARLLEAADRDIRALTQDGRDLATLDEQERTRLFNAQETIMAIVGNLKRSQLVCTYRQNVGTRFRTKHCVTREMADAQKRAARESTHTAQNPMCVPGEGKPCQ